MRVIEPHQLRKQKPKKTKKRVALSAGIFALVGVLAFSLIAYNGHHNGSQPGVLGQFGDSDKRANAPDQELYRYFAPPEFQQLYSQFVYPNTKMLNLPPKITGDTAADTRIRTIASSRGFVLRSIPVAPIVKVEGAPGTEDNLLQEKANTAWQDLQRAAQRDNIPLSFSSGYRSIELQRQMFLLRLKTAGITTALVTSGKADNQIAAVLKLTAIPGYSRHQSGYTIDVACGDGKTPFASSSCYQWLKRDNYLRAKRSGWLPSYPEGVSDNSPEPESSEYVWVGQQAVLKE